MPVVALQVLAFKGGGDLFNLLVERDTFDEQFTRYYAAEVRQDNPIRGGICF